MKNVRFDVVEILINKQCDTYFQNIGNWLLAEGNGKKTMGNWTDQRQSGVSGQTRMSGQTRISYQIRES